MPRQLNTSAQVALAGLTLALSVTGLVRHSADGPSGSGRVPASAAVGTSAAATGIEFHFLPQAQRRYVYGFAREVAFSGLTGKNPKVAYHGELSLEVLSADERGFEAVITDRVSEYGKPSPTALRARVDSRGESVQFFSDSAVKTEEIAQHQAILKDLMAQLIFPLQRDTVGTYAATLTAQNTGDHYQKTKLRYLSSNSGNVAPQIVSSLHELEWDSTLALPKKVKGAEVTQQSGSSTVKSTSTYQIQFLRAETGALASDNPGASGLNVAEGFDLTLFAHRHLMADQVFSMSELSGLDQLGSANRMNVFHDLLGALRAGQVSPNDLLALLKSQNAIQLGASSQLFKTVVGALAGLGTPEAQAAVINLYQDPELPVTGKGSILAALTTTQASLQDTTRSFLSNEMSTQSNPDLASGAAYALGSSLQNTAQNSSSSPQVNAAVAQIQQLWTTASSAGNLSQEMNALDAMGNSGRSEYLTDLTNVIDESADADLRAKAVFALRYMTSDQATQLLSNSLSDASNTVRLAAVQAIQTAPWNTGFQSAVASCASMESVNEIRSACQSLLNKNSS
jgi:HEAT repeat protein